MALFQHSISWHCLPNETREDIFGIIFKLQAVSGYQDKVDSKRDIKVMDWHSWLRMNDRLNQLLRACYGISSDTVLQIADELGLHKELGFYI